MSPCRETSSRPATREFQFPEKIRSSSWHIDDSVARLGQFWFPDRANAMTTARNPASLGSVQTPSGRRKLICPASSRTAHRPVIGIEGMCA